MRTRIRIANRSRLAWLRAIVLVPIWGAIAGGVIAAAIAITTLRRWAKDLPPVPDLAAWTDQAPRSSRIVAADGSVLAELPFADGAVVGHRWLVTYDDLPPLLVHALLAAEDVRFFEHDGVDFRAVARAAWANYRAGAVVEGASTITQQVARNLLPDDIGRERNLRRKVREALLAREIERRWSKRDILTLYANFVFLGDNAYGVRAAARAYFDRDLADLTPAQAAMIAGLAQAPGRADPLRDPAAARARRDDVLDRMHKAGWLSDDDFATASAQDLGLAPAQNPYGSLAPWYTEHVRRLVAESMSDELALGGLEIETAALPALSIDAEARAREHADRFARGGAPPEVGALLWDHTTGYVEALVGGRTWGTSQFDRVLQACRQPGSAWKPMVYGAALESDAITEGTALRDAPVTEYDEMTGTWWKPRSGKRFRGVVLARDAFAASINAPAIDVLDRVGADNVIAFAKKLGITSEVADVRPMALGASCVKPIELARAYAVIARGGWSIAPRFVVRVRRGDDVVFDAAVPEDPWLDPARRLDRAAALAGTDPDERVGVEGTSGALVDPRTAFLIEDLMRGVVERGTATAARGLGRPAAGKTGTTNDNTDAWFIGFTARELAAVWVGHDDPSRTLGPKDDGAHAALPLWMTLIRLAEGDRPARAVPGAAPTGMSRARIDTETGLLSAPGAGGGEDLWFKDGTAPTDSAARVAGSAGDYGRTAHEF